MLRFEKNVEDRKELVKRLGELTGIQPVYMRTPTYAFTCGDYTVNREGDLLIDEEKADAEILTALMTDGLITGGEVFSDADAGEDAGIEEDARPETEESETMEPETETEHETEEEPDADTQAEELEIDAPAEETEETEETAEALESGSEHTADRVSVDEEETNDGGIDLNMPFPIPIGNHTGTSLRNLVNLIYSRGPLISTATGGRFEADTGLIEKLKDDSCTYSPANFRKAVGEYEGEHGKSIFGLTITPEEIIFTGFGKAADVEHLEAFGHLALMMNAQALNQKRIQAKKVDDSNEKYAMRIWLVRIGMGGPEFKKTRAALMENLGGHMAFRTQEEAEKAKAKAQKKRDARRAAKAEAAGEAEEAGHTVPNRTEPAETPNTEIASPEGMQEP